MAPFPKPPSVAAATSNTNKTTAKNDNNTIANSSIEVYGVSTVDSSYAYIVLQQLFTTYPILPSMGSFPLS
eukprot:8087308-Ditylum_brightwellii.AAC.1